MREGSRGKSNENAALEDIEQEGEERKLTRNIRERGREKKKSKESREKWINIVTLKIWQGRKRKPMKKSDVTKGRKDKKRNK